MGMDRLFTILLTLAIISSIKYLIYQEPEFPLMFSYFYYSPHISSAFPTTTIIIDGPISALVVVAVQSMYLCVRSGVNS